VDTTLFCQVGGDYISLGNIAFVHKGSKAVYKGGHHEVNVGGYYVIFNTRDEDEALTVFLPHGSPEVEEFIRYLTEHSHIC